MDKGARNAVDLCGFHIDRDRDVTLDAVVGISPLHIVADGEGRVVGGHSLRDFPVPCAGAVAIVDGVGVVAAADGFLVVSDSDNEAVSGLVGEVVDAGEPSLAEIVRYRFEAHAEVVDIVAPPMHSAPALAESVATVADVEG